MSAVLAAVAAALGGSVVHGTDAVEGVPFVPLASLLTASGVDATDARAVYSELAGWLADRVVVVDDTEQLDLASGILLSHAVRAGATVIAGVGDLAGLSPAFLELTTSWVRDDLGPLTDDALIAMAAQRLGAELDPTSVAGLLGRAAGLPAVAADLISQASDHGRHTAGGFDFRGFRPGPRSLALRGHRFEGMTTGEAELLAALVLAGRLPGPRPQVGSVASELVARGLARIDHGTLSPAGDLVVDVVLPQLGPDRWPHLARVGLDALPGTGPWDTVRRRLRLLAGEDYDDRAALEIGTWLLRCGRPDLCLNLVAERTDPVSLLLRARAGTASGIGFAAALADLDRAAESTEDPEMLASIAQEWGMLLRERLSDQVALRKRIAAVVDRMPDVPARDQARAVIERRRAFVGEPDREGGDLEDQDASTRALSTVMAGELRRAQQIVAEAPEEPVGADPEFERTMRVLVDFLPVVYDGQMALARSMAEEEYRRARNEGGAGAGLWGYNRAKISLHSGQYHHTVMLAVVAGRHLAWRDGTGLAMPCLALQMAGLARVGRLAEADALVARFSSEERLLPRIAIGIARVEAERRRWAGHRSAAADVLARVGRQAIADGEAYSGVLALDESFMLEPRPDVAADLSAYADRSGLLHLCAMRAEAMLERDIRAMAVAAEQLEILPMPGRAAHLWRAVARLQRDGGREAASRAAERRAQALVTEWGLASWPETSCRPRERLTMREWQVARRAAARIRSREIAAELGLSVRTVDNHLSAGFRKLGVSSRDELAGALDASMAPIDLPEDMFDL